MPGIFLVKSRIDPGAPVVFTGTDQFGDLWTVSAMTGTQAFTEGSADTSGNNSIQSGKPYGAKTSAAGPWRTLGSSLTVFDAAGTQQGGGGFAEWQAKLVEFGPYFTTYDVGGIILARFVLQHDGQTVIDSGLFTWPRS